MALDGIVVHAIVNELQECVGGRIGKIHQPSENEVLLQIRAKGRTRKLLLSANPTYPRAHYTEASASNPMEPPMFCMLLRKYCENGIIEGVEQQGMERIISIRIRHRNELGDLTVKELLVEIMGRHSNLILLDPETGNLLDGINHVTPAISSYRVILPGSSYKAPPEQGKLNPLTVDRTAWAEKMSESALAGDNSGRHEAGSAAPEQKLVGNFSGISPLIAKEIVYRGLNDNAKKTQPGLGKEQEDSLWEAFSAIMTQVSANEYEPGTAVDRRTGKLVFSAIRLNHLGEAWKPYDSISQCLENYYGEKAERDAVRQRTSDLLRFLQNEKTKNSKKLDKLQETLEEAKEADRYRIQGELLTASMHLFDKGADKVEVINYYDEEQKPVTIDLDPLLTPSENAQKYFKKYTKIKNSRTVVQEQIESTKEEILYLESLLQQLDNATLNDIEEIRDELTEQGYLRERSRRKRKANKPGKPVVSCFTSSEGIPIYVGKNNTQNEYLTNRLAHSADTWLHTKDIPGSHVVIRSAQFGESTLFEAALLAAYYSQARESSQVPVDYTLIRHVRKPNGSKPGFVIYDNQKTLFVTPDEESIKRLTASGIRQKQ